MTPTDSSSAAAATPRDQTSVRGLLRLALPLIAGMGVQALMLFTDRVLLAELGPAGAAVGFPAGITAHCAMCFFQAAAFYVATFAAHEVGAGTPHHAGRWLGPGAVLAVIAGLCTAVLMPALPVLYAGFALDTALRSDLATLTAWYLAAALPATLSAACAGFLSGTGRTGRVLLLGLGQCLVNAALNAGLIFGLAGLPRLGIVGSGIGTCLASWLGAATALALILRREDRQRYATTSRGLPSPARCLHFLRFAAPQGLRSLAEVGLWTGFVFALGALGAPGLLASNAVLNWNMLTFLPMIGLHQAISIAVGTAQGAGRPDLAERAVRSGLRLEFGYALLVGVAVVAGADALLAVFVPTSEPDVLVLAHSLLVIAALWGLGDALNLTYSGGLSGAGDTRWPMLAMLVCGTVVLALPMTLVLLMPAELRRLGLEPVLAAWLITLAFVWIYGGLVWLRWRRGTWRSVQLREPVACTPPPEEG